MAIFVSQGEAKSQFRQIFKSQNLIQFLRFGPNFLHVSSISIEVQSLNSNMGPKTTPSPNSKGGIRYPPPLAWDGINTPLEVGLRNFLQDSLEDSQRTKRPEILHRASLTFIYVIPDVQSHLDTIQESRMSSKTPWRTLLRHKGEYLLPMHQGA